MITQSKQISKIELQKVHRHTPLQTTYSFQHQTVKKQFFCQQSTSIATRQQMNDIFFNHQEVHTWHFFLVHGYERSCEQCLSPNLCSKGLSYWSVSGELGVRICPFVTFPRRILFKRPLGKMKRPTTSSWHYLTWAVRLKSHYMCPGLPSSL